MDAIVIQDATVELKHNIDYEGNVRLYDGWVYLPDKNEFVPTHRVEKVHEPEETAEE